MRNENKEHEQAKKKTQIVGNVNSQLFGSGKYQSRWVAVLSHICVCNQTLVFHILMCG